MVKTIKTVLILGINLFFILFLSTNIYADQLMKKIKNSYLSIKDLRGTFVQTSKIKDIKREMRYEGEVFIKMPKKMFWKYKGEDIHEVYVNKEDIFIYQEKHNQAFRSQFTDSTFGQIPIVLLSGLKDVENDFKITEDASYVRLIPKSPFLKIKHINLYPSVNSKFPVQKFVVIDKYNNEIEIVLNDIEINTGLSDSIFIFNPPPGVNIIEH